MGNIRKAILIVGGKEETKILALPTGMNRYTELAPPVLKNTWMGEDISADPIPLRKIEYELICERKNGDLVYRKKR